MPARSRPSLRVSRKDASEPGENAVGPPPPKRPRLNPVSSRRRRSSPDLLDTTIDSTPSIKLRRPRPLFAPSARTTSSPPPGVAATPRPRNLRFHHNHHDTPNSASAALYLNGGRESPDPLDTISPAPAPAPRSAPKPPATTTTTPTPAAYSQRRVTQSPKANSKYAAQGKERTKLKDTSARPARSDPAPDHSAQQPTSAPVETADRTKEKRRSLRSRDGGSRAKSELAQYFPNYDQLISLEPPKTGTYAGTF